MGPIPIHILLGIFLGIFVQVCLFDLILYVTVNNFSVMPGQVILGLSVLSRA